MQLEIKLKYYNSALNIGFNNLREAVYDCNTNQWLKAYVHKGRLVYGKKYLPYIKVKEGVDNINFVVQEYCPF